MQFDATTINMLVKGIWETIYMVFLSSALSYVIGIPPGNRPGGDGQGGHQPGASV